MKAEQGVAILRFAAVRLPEENRALFHADVIARTLQMYQSIFNHPIHGEILNVTESAKYLGISRKRFREIAPGPDHIEDDIYPFWSRRVLDILPIEEDFSHDVTVEQGIACGKYLIEEMQDAEIRSLREDIVYIIQAEHGFTFRRHLCGGDEATRGLDLSEKAAWFMENCDCPASSPEKQLSYILEKRGVKRKFVNAKEARVYRTAMLSAIKRYVVARVSEMASDEAHQYIVKFWGIGSYLSILDYAGKNRKDS